MDIDYEAILSESAESGSPHLEPRQVVAPTALPLPQPIRQGKDMALLQVALRSTAGHEPGPDLSHGVATAAGELAGQLQVAKQHVHRQLPIGSRPRRPIGSQ